MKFSVYNTSGTKTGDIEMPEEVFNLSWNGDLVHQVLSVQRMNRRTPTTHTKDRNEKRGGGAKPWRQKGTGNARHGSRRSPIWRGGGVTHGPRNEKNIRRQVPEKMKRKALRTLLSQKARDGQLLFVDQLNFLEPKTREAKGVLEALSAVDGYEELSSRRRNSALVAVPEGTDAAKKSFRNMGNVALQELRNMNPLDVAQYKYIVVVSPEAARDQFAGEKKQASPDPNAVS
jgi:large subunit ribosomal protein L4